MYQPRVFIADDHPLVLEGFRQLLAHDTVIVGTAHSGGELLEKVQQAAPDIVLLDVSMPDTNGFELIQSLKKKVPRVRIIFVTMLSEPFHVSEGFRNGANGYVLKQSASAELMTANGLAPKTIATTMGISIKTVEFHKSSLVKKLGLKTASDLTRFALAEGLTEL